LTQADVDEWNTTATAGLELGPGDVLDVRGAGRIHLNTPTYVDTNAYGKVNIEVRVDEGESCLRELTLYAGSSTYSAGAHEFLAEQESGQFFGPIACLEPVVPPPGQFHVYTFDLTSHPLWEGSVKYLDLEFLLERSCLPPGGPPPCAPPNRSDMRHSVKRVWMEEP
jgi:hypothetical protein